MRRSLVFDLREELQRLIDERRRVVTLLVDASGGTVELVLRDRALQAVLERGAAVA